MQKISASEINDDECFYDFKKVVYLENACALLDLKLRSRCQAALTFIAFLF